MGFLLKSFNKNKAVPESRSCSKVSIFSLVPSTCFFPPWVTTWSILLFLKILAISSIISSSFCSSSFFWTFFGLVDESIASKSILPRLTGCSISGASILIVSGSASTTGSGICTGGASTTGAGISGTISTLGSSFLNTISSSFFFFSDSYTCWFSITLLCLNSLAFFIRVKRCS